MFALAAAAGTRARRRRALRTLDAPALSAPAHDLLLLARRSTLARATWRNGDAPSRRSRPRSAAGCDRWAVADEGGAPGERAAGGAGAAAGPRPPPGVTEFQSWRSGALPTSVWAAIWRIRARRCSALARGLAQLPRTRVVLSSRLYRSRAPLARSRSGLRQCGRGRAHATRVPALLAELCALEAALAAGAGARALGTANHRSGSAVVRP